MCAPKVMDRLVCGDVGFGKTEVAMRAAFIAAQNGRQTRRAGAYHIAGQPAPRQLSATVLPDWPYTVEVVSRFKSAKDLEGIIVARVQSLARSTFWSAPTNCSRVISAFVTWAF